MSIRRKTLLVTVLTVVGVGITVFTLSWLILTEGFARIEHTTVEDAVDRVHLAIEHELEILNSTAAHWAESEDSYRFVQDRNPQYIESNLNDSSVRNLGADLILYFNRRGEVVYGRQLFVPGAAEGALTYQPYQDEVIQIEPLLEECLRGEVRYGSITCQQGLALIAARPILTSAETGPVMGVLVLGRHITGKEVASLSRLTLTRLAVWRTSDNRLPVNFASALAELRSRGEPGTVVVPINKRHVAGYALLDDLYGRPAGIIRADVNRDVLEQGNRATLYLSLALIGSMAAFGLLINWLLQRMVIKRLLGLNDSLQRIAVSSDTSGRVVMAGEDELAALATTVNAMLGAIEQSQQALRENEERLNTVVNSVQAGIMVVDAETHQIVQINDAAVEISGHRREDILGHTCFGYICPAEEGRCPITDLHQQIDTSERTLVARDGQAIPVLKRAVEITLSGRRCILESFFDITDRKRAEEALRYQAYHDGLTRLPNRQRFQEELAEAVARGAGDGTGVAVLMLDLDRFKTINDTLGHTTGDKLLQAVADRLATCLRSRDAVARLGGDEFAVMMAEVREPEAVVSVARRLRECLRPPFHIDGVELYTTASVGVSIFPQDGATVEELVQRADVALYHAKGQGRDTLRQYASWIDASARERLALENDLHHALDRGEFLLHYQPQVYVPTGHIAGLEALLRWQHPRMGLVMPLQFIPLAEEAGLMSAIGEWVVAEACRQARSWLDEGVGPVRIAVNLSPSQFRQRRLEQVVARALGDYSLDPALLELEITETAVMLNIAVATDLMARLKQVGVRLCLDDFGVGNTSLVHLKQFPIDTVKVDGSFLRAIETNATDAAIVSAIIGIGDSLGLLVIGEGVETLGQMEFLSERGCETMQGFLFSRPVPAAEAERMLREGRLATTGASLVATTQAGVSGRLV